MDALLTQRWSSLLLRGSASMAFAVLTLVWPGVTLVALALMFGAYAMADGVITVAVALKRGPMAHRRLMVADGLIGIGAAVATLMWPGLTLLALVLIIGVRFLATGVVQIMTAIALRHDLDVPALYGLGGFASIAIGVVTFFVPALTARALIMFLGLYAFVFGIAMAMMAFRLRHTERALKHA
jgi:uncharacterized membrane protein HdeD (DUF308 family)